MARLSSTLVQGMMNPAYSGRLADGVQSGMQGIADGYAARRQRHGMESINAMLSKDPTDPNVISSAQAVGSQMGMDPTLVQGTIDQAKQMQRAAEDQAMQKESHEQNKAIFGYQKAEKARKEEERKVVGMSVAEATKNPEKTEEIIASLPVEHQPAARAAIQDKMNHDIKMSNYKEEQQGKQPFSKETVEAIKKTEGMADAVGTYEAMKEHNPRAAKRLLLDQYEKVMQNELITGRTAAQANRPLTSTEIKNSERLVEDMNLEDWKVLSPSTWGDNDAGDLKGALAQQVAFKSRDPQWAPTPENIKSLYEDLKANQVTEDKEAKSDMTEDQMLGQFDAQQQADIKATAAANNMTIKQVIEKLQKG